MRSYAESKEETTRGAFGKVERRRRDANFKVIQDRSVLKTKDTIYHAECPPSIFKSAPVIKELASLSKKTAAPRYSFGFDSLPSIFSFGHCSLRSGYSTNSASTIFVTI